MEYQAQQELITAFSIEDECEAPSGETIGDGPANAFTFEKLRPYLFLLLFENFFAFICDLVSTLE